MPNFSHLKKLANKNKKSLAAVAAVAAVAAEEKPPNEYAAHGEDNDQPGTMGATHSTEQPNDEYVAHGESGDAGTGETKDPAIILAQMLVVALNDFINEHTPQQEEGGVGLDASDPNEVGCSELQMQEMECPGEA